MISSICTLFEGHYHFGVASLINSAYKQGFKGDLYAGYRGDLPNWALQAKPNDSLGWDGAKSLTVADDLLIHFLPLSTPYHLTNFKPDFMLQLLDGPATGVDSLFYFDPDIVICAPWKFFNEWSTCGVALSEDVNSPLDERHPRRIAWRKYFGSKEYKLTFKSSIYVNGGFVGISNCNRRFLELWKNLQIEMSHIIGGLNRSALSGAPLPVDATGPFAPFSKTDQDALNASVEAWDGEVSFIGKEGMAFKAGAALMPHALGQPKPWHWKPLVQALAGQPPRTVDREYWKAVNSLIITHSNPLVKVRRVSIYIAALIGRFYRRGSNGDNY